MNPNDLQSQVALGENSRRQFKRDVTNADALAAEMAAFSNSEGGVVYLGMEFLQRQSVPTRAGRTVLHGRRRQAG